MRVHKFANWLMIIVGSAEKYKQSAVCYLKKIYSPITNKKRRYYTLMSSSSWWPQLPSSINTTTAVIACLILSVFCAIWILLFTFNPTAVQIIGEHDIYPSESAEPDVIKCWIYSTLVTIILAILFWILYSFGRRNATVGEMMTVVSATPPPPPPPATCFYAPVVVSPPPPQSSSMIQPRYFLK